LKALKKALLYQTSRDHLKSWLRDGHNAERKVAAALRKAIGGSSVERAAIHPERLRLQQHRRRALNSVEL